MLSQTHEAVNMRRIMNRSLQDDFRMLLGGKKLPQILWSSCRLTYSAEANLQASL